MKLERLTIRHLPGIAKTLELRPAADRASIVIGPNASGKSSLIRALATLLDSRADDRFVELEARFSQPGGESPACVTGIAHGQLRIWRRDGREIERPDWPETEQLAAFLIRADELLDSGEPEQQVSGTLRRLMAGGFDLDALSDSARFRPPKRPQKLARQYAEATREIRELEDRHAELSDAIDRLDQLSGQHLEAVEAGRRLEALRRALELLEIRQKLHALRSALAEFPEGMQHIDGGMGEQLTEIDRRLTERERQIDTTRRAIEHAFREQRHGGIEDVEKMQALRAQLADQRQQLQALEARRAELDLQMDSLAASRNAAERRAGRLRQKAGIVRPQADEDADEAEDRLSDDRLDRLDQAVDQEARERAAIHGLEDEIDWREQQAPDDQDLASSTRAAAALRTWLRRPAPSPTHWIIVSLLLAGTASGTFWLLSETAHQPAGLVLAGAVLAPLSHWLVLAVRAGRSRSARLTYLATGKRAPRQWRVADVERRLDELEQSHSELLRRRADAERVKPLRAQLESARRRLLQNRKTVNLAALALRIDPDWARTTSGLLRVRALYQWFQADDQMRGLEAGRIRHDQCIEALQKSIGENLRQADRTLPEEITADAVGHILNLLEPELAAARSRRDALAASRARLLDLENEAAKLRQDRSRLFSNAGLEDEDRAGLKLRLEHLTAWRNLGDELRGLEHALRGHRNALESDPDLLEQAEAGDHAGLLQTAAGLEQSASRRDHLKARIATIESEHRAALGRRELETLNAARERIRGQLEQAFIESRRAEAGRFLIERARAAHARQHQPGLLKRARALFGQFTRAAFELQFDGRQFSAIDHSAGGAGQDRFRTLAQLSTATRIQLLLALRLAWIDEASRGRPRLPIILDEVLATSDPERYRAIVEALQQLVRDGRQVIYLSAQPADAAAWRRFAGNPQPLIIELQPLDSEAADFTLSPDIVCPDPALDPGRWAQQAGVAALDPWAAVEAMALFHIARDRLEALNALRVHGIVTLGQFEHARALELELPVDAPTVHELDARARAARAWLERWRHGHTRPVEDRLLHESDAISETFTEQVVELNRSLGGDAGALLEALREGRVPRFRTAQADKLQSELADHGLLDQRHPPSQAQLIDALAQILAIDDGAAKPENRLAAVGDTAGRLNQWLQAAVESSASGQQPG